MHSATMSADRPRHKQNDFCVSLTIRPSLLKRKLFGTVTFQTLAVVYTSREYLEAKNALHRKNLWVSGGPVLADLFKVCRQITDSPHGPMPGGRSGWPVKTVRTR